MGLYLHSKGLKRRQLEALCRLGVCCSYETTQRSIKRQTARAASLVAERGHAPTVVTAYDNFEQMEHVKEQRLDNQNTFHSVTTGELVEGIEMPVGGLQQSMLNSSIELQVKDIFNAGGNQDDSIHLQVSFDCVHL
jgi:hypothetical protein